MSSRSMKEAGKSVYRKAVQVTSDAMSAVDNAIKQDRAQTAAYKASQAAKAAPAPAPAKKPSVTPNYEPRPFRAARYLGREKTEEALRNIEGK